MVWGWNGDLNVHVQGRTLISAEFPPDREDEPVSSAFGNATSVFPIFFSGNSQGL